MGLRGSRLVVNVGKKGWYLEIQVRDILFALLGTIVSSFRDFIKFPEVNRHQVNRKQTFL